jgi:hypothetical protein
MSERTDRRQTQDSFDLDDHNASPEMIESRRQLAEEREIQLKRELEMVERQRRELEELGRRKEQLEMGRAEMQDKLTRSLVAVEREILEAHSRIGTMEAIQQSFRTHLNMMEQIEVRSPDGSELQRELTIALSAVEDARTEFARVAPKIRPDLGDGDLDDDGVGALGNRDFLDWLKMGTAFTAPLILVLVVIAVILISRS